MSTEPDLERELSELLEEGHREAMRPGAKDRLRARIDRRIATPSPSTVAGTGGAAVAVALVLGYLIFAPDAPDQRAEDARPTEGEATAAVTEHRTSRSRSRIRAGSGDHANQVARSVGHPPPEGSDHEPAHRGAEPRADIVEESLGRRARAVEAAPRANAATASERAERERRGPGAVSATGTTDSPASAAPGADVAPIDAEPTSGERARSTLQQEVALLGRAQRALERDAPRAAIAALDEHARRFPEGVLRDDREATRWIARCSLDPGARPAGRAYAEAHPRSPLAARLGRVCAIP